MAIGKGSRKKKGGRKKQIDPMSRKDWVQLNLAQYKGGLLRPETEHKGSWTVVNRSSGTVLATANLLGRQFEVRADDVARDMTRGEHQEAPPLNNFVLKYKVVAVKNDEKACVCLPCGIRPTKGHLGYQMKKMHTTIDSCVDFKTLDGYLVRVMVKAITKKQKDSVKSSAYAKASQVRQIREKLAEVVKEECQKRGLSMIVNEMFATRRLSSVLENSTIPIYPLADEFMFWLRILKEPQTKFKYDMLTVEAHDEMEEDIGEDMEDDGEEVEQ